MLGSKYSIRYIPGFEKDLSNIVDFIVFKLNTPMGALNLLNKVENAILERLTCPLSFEPYQSNRKRKYSYYRIYVDNFTVYYVGIGDVMEVRRILYNGRNAGKILK